MKALSPSIRALFNKLFTQEAPSVSSGQLLSTLDNASSICSFLGKSENENLESVKAIAKDCPFLRQMDVIGSDGGMHFPTLVQSLVDPVFVMKDDDDSTEVSMHDQHFAAALQTIKDEQRYRVFINIIRNAGDFPRAQHVDTGRQVTVWCSNDYLGMGQHPNVVNAMKHVIDTAGAGSGGTRNIGGTSYYHVQLEKELAEFHKKEAALVCTSGYVANEAALSTLPSLFPQGAIYYSDAENHASMIRGMKNSRIPKSDLKIFRHNDMVQLEDQLANSDPNKVKIIVFESVYSMSGTIAPTHEIVELAKKYEALTFVDEVHAVGLYGKTGAGVSERDGVEFDILSATLGKAIGVHGGYIAASQLVIDCIRSYAPNFIFTTSLPPAVLAGASASIQTLKTHGHLRDLQQKHVKYMKKQLKKSNLPVLKANSHIIPLFIGCPIRCKTASDMLLNKYGIYVQPINYPTVAKGEELLRLSPGPLHTKEIIDEFVDAASAVWTELGLVTYSELQEKGKQQE